MQRVRGVLLLTLLLAVPRLMLAQGVTTASVSGTVTDTKGQPIPGATVIVLHTPSGTKYGSSTQLDGRYFIRGLRVGGPYVITVSNVGYKTQEVRNINLEIGQNLELNFKLPEQAISVGGVEVVAERNGLMNTNRTGAATTVSKAFIESFPTITRSFQDFEALSPNIVGNSALGRNNRYNNIQLDGTNYNDLFGLADNGTPGGQAGTTPISLDAIQEFQVALAPFDVRQGGFTGAEVNAITRSGTNQFTGSLYFYGQNQNFVGTSPDAFKTPYPTFSNVQTGLRLGGPIVKDQLFFFVNGEITRERQPLYNTMNPPSSAVQIFNSVMQNYGYNPGGTSTYTLLQPSNKLFLRLDYNISESEKLTVRDNYVNASQDNLSRDNYTYTYSSNDYTFQDKTNSITATLNSTFNPTMSNELILGYTTIRDNRVVPGQPFPMVEVYDDSLIPNGGEFVAGTEQYSGANALSQDVFELTDNFSLVSGANLFTFGTHEEIFGFNNLFIRDHYGWYLFNSLADFAAGKPAEYQYSYSNLPGVSEPRAKWNAVQYGVYAQDEWAAMPNLKVTFGLRLDVPTFPDKPLNNPTFDSTFAFMGLRTDQVPKNSFLFAPRLGFNWDVSGDRLTILRGGIGVFSGRVPYVWISNQYSNTGMDISRVDATGLPAGFFDPNVNTQPTPGTNPSLSAIKTSEIDLTANNFKLPQVARLDLAVDHEIGFGVVGTIEGMYSQSINDVLYEDINIKPTGQVLSSDGRPLYGTPVAGKTYWNVNKINSAYTNVVYMTNTNKPYEYSITGELQRRFGEGILSLLHTAIPGDQLFANVSYTFGHSYDQNAVTSSQAISQWRYNPVPGNPNDPPLALSDFDVPSRVVVSVSERVEYVKGWSTTLSIFYNGHSGSPFSYIYYGDVNGDGQRANDLVYVPKNANDIVLTTNNYAQLDAFINGDPYLSKYRGQIVPRNGGRAPWENMLNLRLAQDIPTVEGQSLEFTLDIINVLNLLNHDWGYVKYVPYGTYYLLSYKGMNAQGQPTFAFYPPKGSIYQNDAFLSRWQLQLGARYNF